jgi:RHS repeat-associated protein
VFTNTYVYDSSDDGGYTVYPGLLYKTTDSEGFEKNGYDSRGRLVKNTRHLNLINWDYTTSYTYNDGDKVSSITYPNSGPVITNSYFHGGSINQVSRGSYNYYTVSAGGYDEFGHTTNFVYGNTLTTTRSYYSVSKRLQSISSGTSGSVFSRTYTYSAGDDILSLAGTGLTNTMSVTYDNLHRIKTYSGLTGSYGYDAVGSITNSIEGGGSTYGYGVRRPQAVKAAFGSTNLYDLCGNMIVRHAGGTNIAQALVYDAENRLVRVAQAGTNFTLVKFGYDGGGSRLWKWFNQTPTNLQVWIGNIYEEKQGKTLYHVFADGQQVCSFEANSPLFGGTDTNKVGYYYHEDNLNSSSALSGSSGAQQEVNVFYPFGRVQTASPQASFKVSNRFTGQVFDDETGLYWYNSRIYVPELGRFGQADTIIPDLGNPQSYNRYSYVLNNPLRYTDPTGHYGVSDWWSDTQAGAGIVGGWASSAGQAIASTVEKPFVTPPVHWDQNSYNNLSGGTLGQQIPGVGNAATAPVKAGINAIVQAGMMAGPMGEEKAVATTLKEGEKAVEEVVEETIRIRHYTNNKGLEGIAESGIIRTSDQDRVFAESARRKALSQVDAQVTYGLKDGRGRNFVETDVPKSQVGQRYNPETGANELVIKGDVPLRNPSFTKRQ